MYETFDGFTDKAAIGSNTSAYSNTSGNGAGSAFGSTGNYGSMLGGGWYLVGLGASSVFSVVLGPLRLQPNIRPAGIAP